MKLYGFQKTTLLDFPNRVASTVFTGGCNLRCPFCHNGSLVLHPRDEIPAEEVFAYAKKRAGILDGVCVSGGEPLLQPDIAEFIARLKEMGLQVKLDTNGTMPDKLAALLAADLVDYVAMDVKNAPVKYAATVGVPNFDLAPIRASMATLAESGIPYEYRTTAVAEFHTPADFAEIGAWIAGAPAYFIQNFVDSGDLLCGGLHALAPEELKACLAAVQPYVPTAKLRGVSI